MLDLLLRQGRVIDPESGYDRIADIAIEDGKVVEIGEDLSSRPAKEVLDISGKIAVPGIIDAHTHLRTVEGHPHAQRMVAAAGVCTAIDLAGPLDNILDSIPGSGSGINIAVLEAARHPLSLSCKRPGQAEREALISRTLERGGLGVKLLGGHFPMDLDICEAFIEDAAKLSAWIAWHVGNSTHGSNIEGLEDAVRAAGNRFLHVAHVNSYCRHQVRDELSEAQEAAQLLEAHPNLFSESYLSPLNGTRLGISETGEAMSKVTATCLKKVGCTPDRKGMERAILEGKAGVLKDDGRIGVLVYGKEGLEYWKSQNTQTTGCFSVNPALSRFFLAQAKRKSGAFAVDAFSTDGGTYPRNVIVENGLMLVQFGAITMQEFAAKSSLNAARALGLPGKGRLAPGADADVTVLDFERKKAHATIVGGRIIMKAGVLCGHGSTVICDERGAAYLERRGIPHIVKQQLSLEAIKNRFVP